MYTNGVLLGIMGLVFSLAGRFRVLPGLPKPGDEQGQPPGRDQGDPTHTSLQALPCPFTVQAETSVSYWKKIRIIHHCCTVYTVQLFP